MFFFREIDSFLDTGFRQYDETVDFMYKFDGIPQGQNRIMIRVLSAWCIKYLKSHVSTVAILWPRILVGYT